MENEPTTSDTSPGETVADVVDEPVEEWPPRYWRETQRGMGRKQAGYVALGMFGVLAILVLISIWAAHNG